jgi:hypothetical protein
MINKLSKESYMQKEFKKIDEVLIKPVDLGTAGISYIKSRLEKAGDLSSLVDKLFGTTGEVFSPLPKNINFDRAIQFERGGYFPTSDIQQWLANHIETIWGNDCQLVFEDVWMQQTDMLRKKPGMFFHNSKVYYLLKSDDVLSSLQAGVTAVSSFFLTGFVISPSVDVSHLKTEADDTLIKELMINTQEVFVSAYDQEGIVVWKK